MTIELREIGISAVGDIPWGTHFCHFYETKQDLLDTVIPYFKAGLESKEFCLWVVSNSGLITVEEAKEALGQAVPDLDRHFSDGNIEILNGTEWYLEESVFKLERVTSAWDAKLKRALARGYDGMRVSGDTFWLGENGWKDFCVYEKQLNDSITDRRMTLLCTYPLAKSGAAEILDVVQTHQFAIARRQGEWKVIGSPGLIQAKAEIKRLNEALQRVIDRTPKPPFILSYGAAVLSVTAALIITLWMRMELGEPATPIVAMFLSTIMFSAWFGGVGPGLLASALSLLALDYYFVTPSYSFAVQIKEVPRLIVFSLSALFVGSLSAAQRSAAESLRQARDVLNGTVQDLKRTNESLQAENAERKRAEEALKESQRRLEVAQRIAHVGHYEHDLDTGVIVMSDENYRILGIQPQDSIMLARAFEFMHPEDRERVHQVRNEAVRTGQHFDVEYRFVRPDGDVRYIHSHGDVIRDEQGRARLTFGVAQDITERKRAEDELKKEKEILEKIFDNIPVMIGFIGEDERVKLVNPEWERTMGWTLQELQEQNVDIFAEAYPDLSYRQEVLDFVAASTGEWVDLKIKVRDGRVIDAACAVVHLSDGTRVAIAQDITERKRAEALLHAKEQEFRAIVENAPDQIIRYDREFRRVYINPAVAQFYGMPAESLIGKPLGSGIGEAGLDVEKNELEHVREQIAAVFNTGKYYDYEMSWTMPTGRTYFSIRLFPELDLNGSVVNVLEISRDITERKQAEEMLQTFSQRLIEAQESERRRVARELHDEIGQALTVIKINLQAVQHSAGASPLAQQLNESAGIVDRALQQVRDLSFNLRPSLLDDLGLIAALRWYVDREARRAGLLPEFVADLSETRLPPELETACFRITQEALTNVVRHAQARRIWVELRWRGTELHLTVRDDGIGFDVDAVWRRRVSDTGLGLQGMQERALILNGKIEITSAPPQGTEIHVWFSLTVIPSSANEEGR